MASYITTHHSGGWRHQLHVPKDLRALLWGNGTKKTSIVRYIERMSRREAEATAREWAVNDAAHLAQLRQIPLKERAEFLEIGGVGVAYNYEDEEEDSPHYREITREQWERERKFKKLHLRAHYLHLIASRVAKEETGTIDHSWDALFAQGGTSKLRNARETMP